MEDFKKLIEEDRADHEIKFIRGILGILIICIISWGEYGLHQDSMGLPVVQLKFVG